MNKKDKIYEIDELLRKNGHEVLRLPPYHCEFNAIELIWAQCKTYYNKHIGRNGHSDEEVIGLWNEALEKCNKEVWENCIKHTEKVIQEWYEREQHLVSIEVEPIIINIGES